ncbi:MAG: hypothetical protein AAGU11_08460 [Syntrophobacteraceae bacterium]
MNSASDEEKPESRVGNGGIASVRGFSELGGYNLSFGMHEQMSGLYTESQFTSFPQLNVHAV